MTLLKSSLKHFHAAAIDLQFLERKGSNSKSQEKGVILELEKELLETVNYNTQVIYDFFRLFMIL